MSDTDIIVIGSGIGGLSCAALLARYGYRVTVCESHTLPGGAAHAFKVNGFKFDSGPSLYSGLSYRPSPNPLRQVLDAIGEDVQWANYDTWGCRLPEGEFETQVGGDQFCEVLAQLRGAEAIAQWRALQKLMEPYSRAAIALPVAALRSDLGAALTLGSQSMRLLPHLSRLSKLRGSFGALMDEVISDSFVCNWLEMLCFLISGLPAEATSAAAMSFLFADWYRPQVKLDYPMGGSGALVNALVRGLRKYGGTLRTDAHVEQVIIEKNRAVGVRLRDTQGQGQGQGSKTLRAKIAVVSNASVWDTLKFLPQGSLSPERVQAQAATPECESFLHLHLGIDGAGLPQNLACHYIVVNDWEEGITTPQNLILISIPSVLDPSLAPPGKHVIHAYTPGNEPFEMWEDLDPKGDSYQRLKAERTGVIWRAIRRVIPDIRDRCEVTLAGTPLTHARFLRRHHGTYGPAWAAGQSSFPGPKTPIKGLFCCGDSTFPGIGLPAVAASGMIAAHAIAPVSKQLKMLKDIGL